MSLRCPRQEPCSSSTSTFDLLPLNDDVLSAVLKHLGPLQLAYAACTCRRLRVLADDSSLWRRHLERRWRHVNEHLMRDENLGDGASAATNSAVTGSNTANTPVDRSHASARGGTGVSPKQLYAGAMGLYLMARWCSKLVWPGYIAVSYEVRSVL